MEGEEDLTARRNSLSAGAFAELQARLASKPKYEESISRSSGDGPFPLSLQQRRLWFLQEVNPHTAAYNENLSVILKGVAAAIVKQSVDTIVARHEILRTYFPVVEGEPRQMIASSADVSVSQVALRGFSFQERKEEAFRLAQAESTYAFDIKNKPPFRACIYSIDDQTTQLTITNHHIISDDHSKTILYSELDILLQNALKGRVATLPALTCRYADYTLWQRTNLSSESYQKKLDYWIRLLSSVRGPSPLPTDRARGIRFGNKGQKMSFDVPMVLCTSMRELGARRKVTLYSILLSAVQVLLYRTGGHEDIVIGGPVSDRGLGGFASILGFFVNTLVYRTDFSKTKSFSDLLAHVSRQTVEALNNREVPFEAIVERLNPERALGYSPIFQVLCTLQEARPPSGYLAENATVLQIDNNTSRLDLSFAFTQSGEQISGIIEFDTSLFDESTIVRLRDQFLYILKLLLDFPETPLASFPLLISEYERRIISERNATDAVIPFFGVHKVFEEAARKFGSQVALRDARRIYTFDDIERQANRLSRFLANSGIGAGDTVGVFMDRDARYTVAILAILKVGACFLPLDVHLPAERIRRIFAANEPKLVIANRLTLDAQQFPREYALCDLDSVDLSSLSDAVFAHEVRPEDIAYVLYTSGTTGAPKGVRVTHANLLNFLAAMSARFAGVPSGKLLAVSSYGFDISILENLWTLIHGWEVFVSEGQLASRATSLPSTTRVDLDFSLFFFSSNASGADAQRYDLLLDSAKFADIHGFLAIWTPERHFGEFGGLFPNPAVTSAALATITNNLRIRAGSVVLPLHDVIRVAEEWAVVDNLSKGRIGLSFASGWSPGDFVLAPESYMNRQASLAEAIAAVKTLWKGGTIRRRGVHGQFEEIGTYPRPVQKDIPLWLTASGNPETFAMAGRMGFNILTHLVNQDIAQLSKKIEVYRAAREGAGYAAPGTVTLMIHTFIGDSDEEVHAKVERPLKEYLRTSGELIKKSGDQALVAQISKEDEHALLERAYREFSGSRALLGGPEKALGILESLRAIGVTEVASLIDFGLPKEEVLRGLEKLTSLKQRYGEKQERKRKAAGGRSIVEELCQERVTHLQCTPSMMRALLDIEGGRSAIAKLKVILLGGEPLPESLFDTLRSLTSAEIYNMYGPTETTIWSSVERVEGPPITIGSPILNTKLYVLDQGRNHCPFNVEGDLYIAGNGVAAGHLIECRLDRSRFYPDPFDEISGADMYDTGDRVKRLGDGRVVHLGRSDDQIKLRGYRIEPREIELALERLTEVSQAAVVVNSTRGGEQLVAFCVAAQPNTISPAAIQSNLRTVLPSYMVPSLVVEYESIPQTTSGKVDRKLLSSVSLPATELRSDTPLTAIEDKVAALWSTLLQTPVQSRDADFFQLGGHSLLAVKLAAQIELAFGIRLELLELLEKPTLGLVASLIEQKLGKEGRLVHAGGAPGKPAEEPTRKTDASLTLSAGITEQDILHLIRTGVVPRPSGISLSYIQSDLLDTLDIDVGTLDQLVFQGKPRITSLVNTQYGCIADITIPMSASALYSEPEALERLFDLAFNMGDELKVTCVSLTGMIPSATHYGSALHSSPSASNRRIQLTTGHATTIATVVLNVKNVLDVSRRSLAGETLGVLGLGSIGRSSLKLLLQLEGSPKKLLLLDVFQKQSDLETLRTELVKMGLGCSVEILSSDGKVPQAFYQSTLMLGATNVGGILDVDSLMPGTIVVDDSAPHCFNQIAAISRMRAKKDVLLVEAGFLGMDRKITTLWYIPTVLRRRLQNTALAELTKERPPILTACMLSALFSCDESAFPRTIGVSDEETCKKHLHGLLNLGCKPSPLLLGTWLLPEDILAEFIGNGSTV